jgi:hypothetical protein
MQLKKTSHYYGYLIFIGPALLLSSCAGIQPYPTHPGPNGSDLAQYAQYWEFSGYNQLLNSSPPPTPEVIKQYEDTMVSARIASINIFYRSYVASLYGGEKKYDVVNDAAVLALAGLGTIGSPTFNSITLKILSATSGFLTGFKAKWDSEIFYNVTLPTIIKTMNANRDLAMNQIVKDKNENLYTRLDDVEKYFEAGSIISAINTLNITQDPEAGVKALNLDKKKAIRH